MDKHKKDKKKTEKINVKDLQKKSEEYLNGWQRAQADYQNLQRETEIKKREWIQLANANLLEELLPIYDNYKLAMAHIPENQKKTDWIIGIIHIKNQLEKFLKDYGIEEIKTVGEKFDVNLHEAVALQSTDNSQLSVNKEENKEKENKDLKEKDEQIIKEEVRAGYKLHGKVIYPAKVIV